MTNLVLLSTVLTTNCGMLSLRDGAITQQCEITRWSNIGYREGTNVVSVGWLATTNGSFVKGYQSAHNGFSFTPKDSK